MKRLFLLLLLAFTFQGYGAQVYVGVSFSNDFISTSRTQIADENYRNYAVAFNPGAGLAMDIDLEILGEHKLEIGAEAVYMPLAFSIKDKGLGGAIFPTRIGYRYQVEDGGAWGVNFGYQFNFMDVYKKHPSHPRDALSFATYTMELWTGLSEDEAMGSLDMFIRYGNDFKGHVSFNAGLRARVGFGNF